MKKALLSGLLLSLLTLSTNASIIYSVDDGIADNSMGLTSGGTMEWANQFNAISGGEMITSVEVAFGQIEDGTAVTVSLYDDVNNDGTPDDLSLLTSIAGVVSNQNTNIFNMFDIMDTNVSESFFVSVTITHEANYYPAAFDQSSFNGQSWISAPSAGIGWDKIDNFGLAGNFLIRANAEAVSEPAMLSMLSLGILGLMAQRRGKKRLFKKIL
ncbi:hypothetical protein [Aliiglaciecola aliphaticivorans]